MKCRSCHNNLLDPADCAICHDLKKEFSLMRDNLILDEFDGQSEEDLKTVNQQTLRLIRKAQTMLEIQVNKEDKYYANTAKEILKLANAAQKALSESVKIEERIKTAANSLTIDQKIELMIRFFMSLPREKRRDLIQKLTNIYNSESKRQYANSSNMEN